ncbi:hypothetical protein BO94DRAFT_578233 [Aspergillus sclerotioniger CBS 115572]|uniref:F-box domain-containing protein n=1 Tax=Aspergillus sclerotioniger CBS 115572 TaxID=1450535 RepID=A0A317VL38_9EURO|nr:hypothetical protein BO94DRAFT_578233 [Aspergillus sclerotioniger CBS 115572]PWY73847.1 hypothetical protein BO94DRAFT_578233 [Aspergillus sclerotioniger CBS 115572]
MDYFSALPLELNVLILENVDDWVSLEHLIQTCPTVAALFEPGHDDPNTAANPMALDIVKCVLANDPIMSHKLDRLFWLCANLRHSPTYIKNDTIARFVSNDNEDRTESYECTMTRTELREMIRVAANIRRLACACLTSFVRCLQDNQPRCSSRDMRIETQPTRHHLLLLHADPPSWIEEYRVYRALWRLQLHTDLIGAGVWPPDDSGHLMDQFMSAWSCSKEVTAGREMRSVSECLVKLYGKSRTDIPCSKNQGSSELITCMPDTFVADVNLWVWSLPAQPNDLTQFWGPGPGRGGRCNIVHWFSQLRERFHISEFYLENDTVVDLALWAMGMWIWSDQRLREARLWRTEVDPAEGWVGVIGGWKTGVKNKSWSQRGSNPRPLAF